MYKSIFHIKKMDCPAEENLIRIQLHDTDAIDQLYFDLSERNLTLIHSDSATEILEVLKGLKLGTELIATEEIQILDIREESVQKNLLWIVLGINAAFFVIEITTGLISKSMGLIADSLDMLADAIVYGFSLIAVGKTIFVKKKVARISGYFQITLAIIGFIEVIRRFIGFEHLPNYRTMIIVSFFALIANAICLYLLQKSQSSEAHMKASMIFTSNDIVINVGVITAGLMVMWLGSNKPDLIIGSIVFLLVIRGALRILALSR